MSEGLTRVVAGDTALLGCTFKDKNGVLKSPSDVVLTVFSGLKKELLNRIPLLPEHELSPGVFEVSYETNPVAMSLGNGKSVTLIYEFRGILDGFPTVGQGKFEMVLVL